MVKFTENDATFQFYDVCLSSDLGYSVFISLYISLPLYMPAGAHLFVESSFLWKLIPCVWNRINSESTREDASSANDDVPLRFSSNRELLDQLYAMAVGVRDFQVAGAKSKLTQLVGEVKNKRVRIKKETFEKPEKTPKSDKKDPTLKKTSSNEKTSTMTEKKSTVKLAVKKSEMQTPQKSLVMQWITPQFDVTPLAKVSPQSGFAKKPSKLKSSAEDEETRITKKSARKNDARPRAEGQSASKKKARVTAYQQTKNMVNQRIHALSLTHQTLSEAATAEVAAAQVPSLLPKLACFQYEGQWWCLWCHN